jgi:hypothetical protein
MGFIFSFSNHRIVKAYIYIYIYIYCALVSHIVLGERALLLSLLDKICLGIDDRYLGQISLGQFSKTQRKKIQKR